MADNNDWYVEMGRQRLAEINVTRTLNSSSLRNSGYKNA